MSNEPTSFPPADSPAAVPPLVADLPRRCRAEPVAERLRALLRAPFGKRGFAVVEIVTHWPLIVGERLADVTLPERLVFPKGERAGGTLEVRVDGPLALELQHLEPQVLEQVNGFCGFKAVARLKLVRGRVPRRSPPPPPVPPPPPAVKARIDRMVATIGDQTLKDALTRLGESIHRHSGETR